MQLNVPPDLETLINKRLSSGGYTSIEDALLSLAKIIAVTMLQQPRLGVGLEFWRTTG